MTIKYMFNLSMARALWKVIKNMCFSFYERNVHKRNGRIGVEDWRSPLS
jgi:hypothetical protein